MSTRQYEGGWGKEERNPGLESANRSGQGPGTRRLERGCQLPLLFSLDSGPAAAAAARYLPMCLLQSGGGGRDGPARHVTSTSRAKEESARVARARLTRSPTERVASSSHSYHTSCEACSADARYRANKDFTGFLVLGVIRKVLPTASRMSTTAARCRAVMTSQDTTSRFPTAALLASRDVVQPLKATNVARGDCDS